MRILHISPDGANKLYFFKLQRSLNIFTGWKSKRYLIYSKIRGSYILIMDYF